jgi:hypothetical protein
MDCIHSALLGLTLSSCTQEANVPVTNNSPNSPTSQTASPSPSVDEIQLPLVHLVKLHLKN